MQVKTQHGIGLIEAMIALLILSLGILGLTIFQARLIAQTTDNQSRILAAMLAEQLLSQVKIDSTNAPCYTYPKSGSCSSTVASAQADQWVQRVADSGFDDPTVAISGTRMTVTVTWNSQAFKDKRTLTETTDVRP